MGAAVTNGSDSNKGVKKMLFFGNAFCYSGQNFCLSLPAIKTWKLQCIDLKLELFFMGVEHNLSKKCKSRVRKIAG